jgi:hypothetical protein
MIKNQTIISTVGTVLDKGIIEVCQTSKVTDYNGNTEIRPYYWKIYPGQDTSSQTKDIQSLCEKTWTPEVLALFKRDLTI